MSVYLVDFRQFVAQVLGRLTRNTRQIAWLSALVEPVRVLYAEFLEYRTATTYALSLSTQTKVLEYALNTKWPAAGGLIYIENVSRAASVFWLFDDTSSAADPVTISADPAPTPYLYDDAAIEPITTSFIVFVPDTLVFVEAEMRALVDRYKLIGTTYQIQLYDPTA